MIRNQDILALERINYPQASKTTPQVLPSAESANEFHNILKGLMPDASGSFAPVSATSPMTQEQLMLLVKALQIQMNSRLYRTVFSGALESNALAAQIVQTYGGKIAPFMPDASNKSQETPKKNLNPSGGNLDRIIQEAAEKFDVDVNLVRSVIKAESNFNPSASSPKGAMGLMQLMPETARELGVQNAYDARENVMGGTRYLKMLLDRYQGRVDVALAAYNWGMGNVEKKPDQLPLETLNYVAKVKSYYKDPQA